MMRKKWYRQEREELDGTASLDTEDAIDELIEKSCVSQEIMQLDSDDREILILFYYQELTLKEIASVIGRSENASMQRLSRARKRLKKILEGLL